MSEAEERGGISPDERRKALDKFFGVGPFLFLQAGQSKRFICLTDFDEFVNVVVHRGENGRVYCPTTDDESAQCDKCDAGQRRDALAAISIYNLSDKVRQLALYAGPKKGPLHSLYKIFSTMGTHKVVIEVSREGSGKNDTTYTFVPVGGEATLPENIVPFTRAEVLEMAKNSLKEREKDEEW